MSDNKSFKVQNGLDVTGDANVSGSVTATSFIGDGSQLTGISGGGTTYSIDETGRGSTDNWIEFDAGVYNNDQVFFKTKGTANTWRGTTGEGGFQFDGLTPNQAFVMEDASKGVKFMGYQYETGGDEGLIIEGKSGLASKSTIYLDTNSKTAIKITDGSVELPNIPTTDPNNTNELWSDNGVIVMSGSTAPAGGGGGLDSAAAISTINDEFKVSSSKVEIGQSANASGGYSIALGFGSTASGPASYAIGDATASGSNALAFVDNAVASASLAIAIGQRAEATGINTIAFGNEADAKSNYAIAIGDNALAGQDSIAIGRGADNAAHSDSIAIGRESEPYNFGIAIGYQADGGDNGHSAVVIGHQAGGQNTGIRAVAIGAQSGGYSHGAYSPKNETTHVGGFAGRTDPQPYSTGIGAFAGGTTQGQEAVAIGRYAGNNTQGNNAIAIGSWAAQTNQPANSIAISAIGNTPTGTAPPTDQYGIKIQTSDAGSLTYDTTNNWVFGSSVTLPGATVSGHIIPDTNAAYDLGSAEKKFRHLYLSNNSLYAESGRLSFEGGQLTFRDDPVLMLSEVQAIAAASDTFEDFKAALASL